jgi:hypothetical protein
MESNMDGRQLLLALGCDASNIPFWSTIKQRDCSFQKGKKAKLDAACFLGTNQMCDKSESQSSII